MMIWFPMILREKKKSLKLYMTISVILLIINYLYLDIWRKMRIFAYRKQLYFCRYERFWSHSSNRARSTVSEAYLKGCFRLVWWVWLSSRQITNQHLLEKMNQAYTGREVTSSSLTFYLLTVTFYLVLEKGWEDKTSDHSKTQTIKGRTFNWNWQQQADGSV